MEQMTLFLVLGGLLFLALVVASISHRYYAFLEMRRLQVEQLMSRVRETEELYYRTEGLSVPSEARQLLRDETILRLEGVRQIHKRYPGIDARIEALREEPAEAAPVVTESSMTQSQVDALMHVLGELLWLLQEKRLMVSMEETERAQLIDVLATRRAETLYRFYRGVAEEKRAQGLLNQALWNWEQIRRLLNAAGVAGEQVSLWLEESSHQIRSLNAEIESQSEQAKRP